MVDNTGNLELMDILKEKKKELDDMLGRKAQGAYKEYKTYMKWMLHLNIFLFGTKEWKKKVHSCCALRDWRTFDQAS